MVSRLSSAEGATLYELSQRNVIVIKNGNASFHFDFLEKVGDEIVRIFYSNLRDKTVVADLHKNKAKLARLAVYNVLSRVFVDSLDFKIVEESMKILDLMILEAFPQE
ncbi:MAG: hypothetical protein ACYCPW_09590 [Nitrososphaerales archaeon]